MSHTIIDRRKNGKNKSIVNRQKFLKRVQTRVRKAVNDFVSDKNITDVIGKDDRNVTIPIGDIDEPFFHHKPGSGTTERVLPGNKKFLPGDTIPKPGKGGGGTGDKAGNNTDGEDDFVFTLTRDEFLQFLFEGLELPDLVQKQVSVIEEMRPRRAGYSNDGTPSRLDLLQSMKQSIGRRVALRNPKKKELRELEMVLEGIEASILEAEKNSTPCDDIKQQREEVQHRITVLRRKLRAIPFVDTNDLRYRQFIHEVVPIHKAVMFCVMDVSGSMDEFKKDLAKRFYMLLYLFLHRNYERIDVVFIRHHTNAQEVSEEEFFYSKESGGTVVSSALELTYEIMKERYPVSQWNIYVAQTSDGDNYDEDNEVVKEILTAQILPLVQCYFYIEIERKNGYDHSNLWPMMESISTGNKKVQAAKVSSTMDIYPVFRSLFEKRG